MFTHVLNFQILDCPAKKMPYYMCGQLKEPAHLRSLIFPISSILTIDPSIVPSCYIYPTDETVSVNGSSQDGNCSGITMTMSGIRSRCKAPTSSVLFDGNIPTLTGLDGDMWASQLLTLQIHISNRQDIISDFTNITTFVVNRVELVMFNCPEWGIAVEAIGIWRATSISRQDQMSRLSVGTVSPTFTSCDSLVRVCASSLAITNPVIILQFTRANGSNRTYLAEVGFYGDSSACPQDTIIATPPPPDTTTPPSDTMATASPPPDTTTPPPSDPTTPQPSGSKSSPTIPIAASIGCVVLLIVCLLAAVLIMWRCYYVKHHKHNTSHHPAVGEGHINTHSHPLPVTLCEETGQVYYSTPQEVAPQESSDTYSHIHHDTITGRGASKKSREGTVAEDVGYSVLSYDKPQEQDVGAYPEVGERQGKKRKKESKKVSADASVDQLYAQVDKKKKKDGDTTHPHPPEADTPVDQLYAQVDKKKKKDGDTHPPEADMQVDQLYAQVDKKNSRKKEACEDSPQESGAVYSVVNKPHPPQVPAKSDLLMDDLYN